VAVLVNIDPDTLRAEIRKILAEDAAPQPPAEVAKDAPEQRFLLGIAYQAGPQPCIKKGQDGGRDYFEPDDLELAAHAYLAKGPRVGLFHMDGTETISGAGEATATVVESYIYRNEQPWDLGDGLVVRKGDWVIGAILSPEAWFLYKSGKISGWSPQGTARRHAPRAAA
jgi:hypothetical protein